MPELVSTPKFERAYARHTKRNAIRACFKNGWRGPLARPGRRPADRNGSGSPGQQAVIISWGCPSRSVRRVAGRHRPVACATQPISKHALRRQRVEQALARLAVNPLDPRLRTHPLSGDLAGFHACCCGYDSRILFLWRREGSREAILLINVGTHDEVY